MFKSLFTWSNDLAYVIGLITTDGNLSKDGRHMSLTSKDLEQIENFAKVLRLNNKISVKKSSYSPNSCYYVIQFGNIKLYRFLISIGLFPNKTKTLSEVKVPDNYFGDFLRGHLDGDGFTYSYWDKRWKSSFMLYTGFISASRKHLDWIKEKVLYLYGINGQIKNSGGSVYHLTYAKNNSLILLNKIYYRDDVICLSRKKYKIDKSLSIIRESAGML